MSTSAELSLLEKKTSSSHCGETYSWGFSEEMV